MWGDVVSCKLAWDSGLLCYGDCSWCRHMIWLLPPGLESLAGWLLSCMLCGTSGLAWLGHTCCAADIELAEHVQSEEKFSSGGKPLFRLYLS